MKQEENTYEELRRIALAKIPDELGLTLPSEKTIVYGIVMDWSVGNGTASIISFITGDASIYFSSGGGIIADDTDEIVKITAMEFVDKAQQILDKTMKTEQTPLPGVNEVIFYLLTNKGIFKGGDLKENFSNRTSIWIGLFLMGNEVLNELRTKKEK